MPYVVTSVCAGCLDRSCVQICPTNCFYLAPLVTHHRLLGLIAAGRDEPSDQAGMLMIHPDECIDCGACETECPVEAIYEDCCVPEAAANWTELNACYTRSLDEQRKRALRQFSS